MSNSWHKKPRKKVSGRKESFWQRNRPIRAKIGPKMAKMAKNRHFFTIIGRFEGVKKSKQKKLFFFSQIPGIKSLEKKFQAQKTHFPREIGQFVPKLAPKWPKWPKIAIFSPQLADLRGLKKLNKKYYFFFVNLMA